MTWIPEFETGHPVIDAQHQGLVRSFNQVVAATTAGKGAGAVNRAISHLLEVTRAHFKDEERLMARDAYPKARGHQAVHVQLISQLQDLAQKIAQGDTEWTVPVLNFMEDWLLCHIQIEDKDLAWHLKSGGH